MHGFESGLIEDARFMISDFRWQPRYRDYITRNDCCLFQRNKSRASWQCWEILPKKTTLRHHPISSPPHIFNFFKESSHAPPSSIFG